MIGEGRFTEAKAIYLATRKRHDQFFNKYLVRPVAALVVALLGGSRVTPNQVTLFSLVLMLAAGASFVFVPTRTGGIAGAVLVELSFLFDCVDGMLARHKKVASVQGHLFDFFTDELKAVVLVGSVGVNVWRVGGYGLDGQLWPAGDVRFVLAATAAVAIVGAACSLTSFVRRPEISGEATPVAAHHEAHEEAAPRSLLSRLLGLAMDLLRLLNHYPAHVWLFAALGRLDLFFWMYAGLNALYLARGWLGLLRRFAR